MTLTDEQLHADIERIKQIAIVPTILDVVCNLTGMRFAAVARVTEDRWIACSVKDHINFGLQPGDELEVKTTLCDEIRSSREPIVIDNVLEDERYCLHHTPKMYGIKSYISIPIFCKNGSFFGTLCAIDPEPLPVKTPAILGMFTLFADLIAFHLESILLLEQSQQALVESARLLSAADEENRHYAHLTHHSLMEPARKIRIFSEILVGVIGQNELEKGVQTAQKLQLLSDQLIQRIRPLKNKTA